MIWLALRASWQRQPPINADSCRLAESELSTDVGAVGLALSRLVPFARQELHLDVHISGSNALSFVLSCICPEAFSGGADQGYDGESDEDEEGFHS